MVLQTNSRTAFIRGLQQAAASDDRVVLVCADSLKVVRGEAFAASYPERYFDVGIAEQNAVGAAVGLASSGLVPFVATYAGFLAMRACEQIRTFAAYPRLNVKLVGANGGAAAGEREGATHQFTEDLGILRGIPHMTVVAPGSAEQVAAAVMQTAVQDGPAYIRIGSGRDAYEPTVDQAPFELGKLQVLEDGGRDVLLLGTGFVHHRTLAAARQLQSEGIGVTTANVHTLKPLDAASLEQLLRRTRAVVTVEDHNVIGGLGSAVAELAAETRPVPVIRVGLLDRFPESGEPEALLDHLGLTPDAIAAAARRSLARAEEV